ncbi:Ca2-binding protein, EF-Hand protein superfamily [Ceraceosorus bombacis]|uniref:Ca2-binding protein, EF-Hand protein superfamily n=1 Tax=Ceraceosorus bombacis TaxID=401625 RepID=A0A0P1BQ72_9BASI|nr:Ca2-binding protein, EF-Hand protein superfamily [Ceraceosorus bombacis]
MSQQYSYGGGGGYGAPPQGGGGGGGYGAPPPHQGGYGGQQQQGYGAPPPQQQYGGGAQGGRPGGGYPPAGSGYPPQRAQVYNRHTGPPPGADPQLWGWFTSCDRDGSGQIDARELSAALVNGDWSPFQESTVKMLMNLFDVDRSGHISFAEFAGLWKYIQDWQGVFRHFDADRSGSIDSAELSRALTQFGYNLSPGLLHLVTSKYIQLDSPKQGALPSRPGANAGINFDGFCRACVGIKSATESFQKFDTQRNGTATLHYEDFMRILLSAP